MALTQITGGRATHWLNTRPGPAGGGTLYSCLVSDVIDGDFICGIRAVVVTADTSGTTRDHLVERLGFQWTCSMPASATITIIRP